MEIERKFLVSRPPPLDRCERVEIEQGYLALIDETGRVEVRLRRRGEQRLLTVKGGTGRSRAEAEVELDRERFDSLWPLTDGRRVSKTRYLIPLGELTVELDVFSGRLEGLLVAEVEFPSDEEADRFDPPPWLGDEVTGDERYLNEHLATSGRP